MDEAPMDAAGAATLRYVKLLVTALSATMIVGVIVLVAVVVMHLGPAAPAFPDSIALPAGTKAAAVTRGAGWLIVVTDDGRVLVFSPDGKTLRQEIAVDR